MSKKDVKKNLLDHSGVKVRLLGEYLKRYLNVISNDGYTERIKVYDLFCGEGVYENEGEGSPLVILRAVKDMHFANVAKLRRVPAIDCQFNDINQAKVQNVENQVKAKSLYYPSLGEIKFTSIDYQEEVKKLVETIPKLKNQKAFIFIDPYDYKHIKASDIRNLLVKGKSEVLLFMPTQFMYRFHANGTPEALKDFIEELTKYKDWKKTDSVWRFIDQLKEAFRGYLGSNFYVDTFTIQKDPSTVFCLFFFSSHIKGFEKMLEAKWEIDTEQGKGWNYIDNQVNLFHEQKTNTLEESLRVLLKNKNKTNREIYEFTLRSGFLPKHTNEIFHNWQQSGNLEVVTKKGGKTRKGAFYLAYNYYKEDHQKVEFRIK